MKTLQQYKAEALTQFAADVVEFAAQNPTMSYAHVAYHLGTTDLMVGRIMREAGITRTRGRKPKTDDRS